MIINNKKIIEITIFISIITTLGTLYVSLLDYFYYKAYYSYFNINIKYIDLSYGNLSPLFVYFFSVATIILSSFFIYNMIRRISTNIKIKKRIDEITNKDEGRKALKEYFFINKDWMLSLFDFLSFLVLTILAICFKNISSAESILNLSALFDLKFVSLIFDSQILFLLLFFLYYKIQEEISDMPKKIKKQKSNIEDCYKNDISLAQNKDKINELYNYTKKESTNANKRISIAQIAFPLIFIICLSLVTTFFIGYTRAVGEKEYKITTDEQYIVLNTSTTKAVLLKSEINDNKLIIDTSSQEIVSSTNLSYKINDFDHVYVK